MADSHLLKIASLNVRGLSFDKVNNLTKLISDYDIIALQEIHNVKQKIINLIVDKVDALFLVQYNYSDTASGVGYIILNKELQRNFKLFPTPNNLRGDYYTFKSTKPTYLIHMLLQSANSKQISMRILKAMF